MAAIASGRKSWARNRIVWVDCGFFTDSVSRLLPRLSVSVKREGFSRSSACSLFRSPLSSNLSACCSILLGTEFDPRDRRLRREDEPSSSPASPNPVSVLEAESSVVLLDWVFAAVEGGTDGRLKLFDGKRLNGIRAPNVGSGSTQTRKSFLTFFALA